MASNATWGAGQMLKVVGNRTVGLMRHECRSRDSRQTAVVHWIQRQASFPDQIACIIIIASTVV